MTRVLLELGYVLAVAWTCLVLTMVLAVTLLVPVHAIAMRLRKP